MWYSLSAREKIGIASLVAVALTAAGVVGARRFSAHLPASAAGTAFLVHVAGAVREPQVVTGEPGMVVAEAIERSGGLSTDADSNRLNLAAQLVPNSRLYVPSIGEQVSEEDLGPYAPSAALAQRSVGFSSGGSGYDMGAGPKVNINSADAAELDKLPGVGPVTANSIIAYRQKIGKFSSVDQLLEVKGIGPKKLEKMRPYVTL